MHMEDLQYEDLIWVDPDDNIIGYGEKLDTHVKNQLHRAFSIFIFDWNTRKLLLQRRASGKYHSGGLWTNACCSHPRRGLSMERSLSSRLYVELGLDLDVTLDLAGDRDCLPVQDGLLYAAGTFLYQAPFKGLSEHELDHVFVYSIRPGSALPGDGIHADPDEIEALRWVTIPELNRWMQDEPSAFTAWFAPAYRLAYPVLCAQAKALHLGF